MAVQSLGGTQGILQRSNAEHNPKRDRKPTPEANDTLARNDAQSPEPRAPAPERPIRRGSDKASRPSHRPTRERSMRSRVAIGVLLALGLMFGFWLLFKLPSN